jgi:hypothetical protein
MQPAALAKKKKRAKQGAAPPPHVAPPQEEEAPRMEPQRAVEAASREHPRTDETQGAAFDLAANSLLERKISLSKRQNPDAVFAGLRRAKRAKVARPNTLGEYSRP